MTMLLYVILALMALKFLGVLPGSPGVETVNVVVSLAHLLLAGIVYSIDRLDRRFRRIEGDIEDMRAALQRVARLEAKLEDKKPIG